MADYLVVALAVTFVCLAALQQIQVTPYPAEVGQEVCVQADQDGVPLVGLQLQLEVPTGETRDLGRTGTDGCLRFVPQSRGQHVLVAQIDGVRVLAPLQVVAARADWLVALGSVPLGLALLWLNLSRARGRRGP